jgi:hypothetical protein
VTAETISSPRRTRRWRYVAVAVAAVAVVVACVVVATGRINLSSGTAEPSPKAEGYTQVGSIDGVNFWLQVRGPNQVAVRTTGRMGGICNNDGPYVAALGPYPVCAQSVSGSGGVFAFVVRDSLRNMSLPLTAGAVMASGYLPLDGLLPGYHLLVDIVPLAKYQPPVFIDGSPTFS